ncbi:MAG: hypothetical protein Q8R83_09350 [Legionellaceae bacterium]|nr:hypothetical protein [Legionellaceae bacterium]
MATAFFKQLESDLEIARNDEWAHMVQQATNITHAYSSRSVALRLLPSFLDHLIKLIKNALLFAFTFAAYLTTFIYDPEEEPMDEDFIECKDNPKFSVTLKACLQKEFVLILMNVGNMALALLSAFSRGILSIQGYTNDRKTQIIDDKLQKNTWKYPSVIDVSFYNAARNLMSREESDEETIQLNPL